MKVLKTPEERFQNIPDYPFKPNFISISNDLEMHYVDEGKGEIILLLHGEPSWSYLYRKMIPILVNAGFRVIAPDLIGFGKSDKPTEDSDYSYENHVKWLTNFMVKMELKNIHLFCQDWGGLLGLFIVAHHQELFKSIIAANTILPMSGSSTPQIFKTWKEFALNSPTFEAGFIVQNATTTQLTDAEVAAYNAPFPTEEYKVGSRIFPTLVPFGDNDPYNMIPKCNKAWEKLKTFEKPFLTLFSDSDPIMNGLEKVFQKLVFGAQYQPHEIMKNGGHFLQEDNYEALCEAIINFLK